PVLPGNVRLSGGQRGRPGRHGQEVVNDQGSRWGEDLLWVNRDLTRLPGPSSAVEDQEVERPEFEERSGVAVEHGHARVIGEQLLGGRREGSIDLGADQSGAGPGSGSQPGESHATSGARLTNDAVDDATGQDPQELAGLRQAGVFEADLKGECDGPTHEGGE